MSRHRPRRLRSTRKLVDIVPNLQIAAFTVFLLFVILGGGSSRNDAASHPWIWMFGIVSICTSLIDFSRADYERVRLPLLFAGLCAGLVAAQLVPLPPAIWTNLPGRAVYADVATFAGIDQPWRPISLAPHATMASLLGLVVPIAVILAFARIDSKWLIWSMTAMVGLALASAVLGLAQLGSGSGGPLRFYAITNEDFAVGLFANRNHQALLLVCALTVSAASAKRLVSDAGSPARTWIPVCIWAFLIPMILLTGSRAGLLLAIPATAIGAWIINMPVKGEFVRRKHKRAPIMKWIPAGLILLMVAVSIGFSRSVALERLLATDANGELRSRLWPSLLDTISAFFPVGSGFGSFDPIYRRFEPFALLRPDYTNRAHNDALELLIEGGLPVTILFGAFAAWFISRSIAAWKEKGPIDQRLLEARCGSAVMAYALLASLTDYPLRTPLFATVFTISALWLHGWYRHAMMKNSTRTTG